MLNNLLNKKRNIYILAVIAILMESFTSACLKIGGSYPFLSTMYIFWFCVAVLLLAFYAVVWQLVLEKIPLTTAYLRKGVSYMLVFLWAWLIFGEAITVKQILGIIVIFIGMVVSIADDE